MIKSSLAWIALGLVSISALAATEEMPSRLSSRFDFSLLSENVYSAPAIDPAETYLRTLAVFDHFGLAPEPDSQPFFDDLQGKVQLGSIKTALPYLDLMNQFGSFVRTDESGEIRVFQDRQSGRIIDYRIASGTGTTESAYRSNLLKVSGNPKGQPLAGLRIALDPGHMGGNFWDEETGKFVRDKRGRKLSEGVLNLQISLLLEKSLTALGAQVMITRRGLTPVSTLPYQNYDIREYGLKIFRKSSLDPWFQSLLAVAPPGNRLYNEFASSPKFKNLFSESQRWQYFILGHDLDARVDAINRFSPDITLIIHLDAGDEPGNPTGVSSRPHNATKVYVPGAFMNTEFATREDRKFFGRHLFDVLTWKDSVKLARSLVHHIHDELNIPFDRVNPENSVEIEPGVQGRNLTVQRRLTSQATAYVEGLFYNDPAEFEALLKTNHPMMIEGQNFPYSDRLEQLATALHHGIVSFVQTYNEY